MQTRFIRHNGTSMYLRRYWEDKANPCTKGSYHTCMNLRAQTDTLNDWKLGGHEYMYEGDPRWPTHCERCGAPVPETAEKQLFRQRRYDNPSGTPEPGDLFFLNIDYDSKHHCSGRWSNCDGNHLHCVLPEGTHWDIDSRANNCTMPDDSLHRCWIRHGDPETGLVHVDKQGHTCAAGAGSIAVPGYHGFLHNGVLSGNL